MKKFHPLLVQEVIRETPQAVSLVFQVPAELQSLFSYKAGQYLTLKTDVNGKSVRRAYSICSCPNSGSLKVTVKEVEGGTFSVMANKKLKAGDFLEVFPPEGKFVYEPSRERGPRSYAGIAAGSGITPILSILKAVLADPQNSFYLLYGNRNLEETIFFEELQDLQAKNPGRLFLQFLSSRQKEENFWYGRIDANSVGAIIEEINKKQECSKFFICGPEEMTSTVKAELLKQEVPEEKIAFELFTASEEGEVRSDFDGFTDVVIQVDGEESRFRMENNFTVMEAALDLGMDLPYSCQGGTCSSCVAVIKDGEAIMKKNLSLTDREVKEGLILTCQAIPSSKTLTLNYDEV